MKDTKIFVCEDCTVVFQVYGVKWKRKLCCPVCGDSASVRPYVANRHNIESKAKIRWKEEELQLLQECIDGKYRPYQVAIMLGRSVHSVNKKFNRMKKTGVNSVNRKDNTN